MKTYEIKSLTNSQLIERTEYLVRRERELVECLVTHLQEIHDRKLFIEMGYTSLFECLVKHFKYSESIAYSRISVLKIMKDIPEVTEALNSGELNVTHLTLAQSYFRQHEKQNQEKLPIEQKRELINSLMNTSTKDAKQILAKVNPAFDLPKDQVRYLDKNHVQLLITESKDILEQIEKLKELMSHENVDPSLGEILRVSLQSAIESIEKKRGIRLKDGASSGETAMRSFADRNSRYISRKVKQAVLKRARHQCEYVHKNGKRCDSRYQTQFDHIKAFSRGGKAELSNIQLLCRVHNSYKSNRVL